MAGQFEYQFSVYDPSFFGTPGRTLRLNSHQIEYMSFCSGPAEDRHPIVLLGGAFQEFSSFKLEVNRLMRQHPVIILELPGQGRSKEAAQDLSFPDFADLMAAFTKEAGLPPIIPVGLSYGSGMAFSFASRHPGLCHKVIMSGTTERIRGLLQLQLRAALEYLEQGNMEEFSRCVVMHLFNPHYASETNVHPELVENMRDAVGRMTSLDRAKYRANTERILALDGLEGRPECPALVVAAEYDNFTTPSDAYGVASKCADATYVLLGSGDHLLPLIRPRLMSAIYDEFVTTGRIEERPEVQRIERMNGRGGAPPERRIGVSKRIHADCSVNFHNRDGVFPGRLLNVSPDGCFVQADVRVASITGRQDLEFVGEGFTLHTVILIGDSGLHCAFIRDDEVAFRNFTRFLEGRISHKESCIGL